MKTNQTPSEVEEKLHNIVCDFERNIRTENVPTVTEIGLTREQTKKAITALIEQAKVEELNRKMTLHVELFTSQDYKNGFQDAVEQIEKANDLRIQALTTKESEVNNE